MSDRKPRELYATIYKKTLSLLRVDCSPPAIKINQDTDEILIFIEKSAFIALAEALRIYADRDNWSATIENRCSVFTKLDSDGGLHEGGARARAALKKVGLE